MNEIRYRIVMEDNYLYYCRIKIDNYNVIEIFTDRDHNSKIKLHDPLTGIYSFDIGFLTNTGLWLYTNDILLDTRTGSIYLITFDNYNNSFMMLFDSDKRFPFPIIMDGITLIGDKYEHKNPV